MILKLFSRFTMFSAVLFFAASLLLISTAAAQSGRQTDKPAPAAAPAKPEAPKQEVPADKMDPAVKAGLESALELFNKTDFAAALESLKKLYGEHPEITPPRIVFANWFAQAKLGEAVRASLEAATDETPDDPEAFLLLGEILLQQQYLTAAESLLNTAESKLQNYSKSASRKKALNTSLLRNQIALAEARSKWTKVIGYADAAMSIDGESAKLLRQKAIALFQEKKEDEAKALFDKADALKKEADDTSLPAEAAMAQLYQLRGDKENSKKSLDAALQKYPKSREVVILSIQARMSEDKLEEAQQLAQQLLTENADWSPAKRLCATIALYLSDYAAAEKLFQELSIASPADTQSANGLALALCEQSDSAKLKRAAEYAAENVRREQQNADYWATLGWILYKAEQYDEAAKALKQAAAAGKVNAASAYYLARLALQMNKSAEAKQLLNAAINSAAPFAKRRDAVNLLKELNK